VVAVATSTRPAPCSNAVNEPFGSALPTSMDLSWSGDQSGCWPARTAAAPATCGAAIDVPDIDTYPSSTGVPTWPFTAAAAAISTPGAVISGLIPPSTLPWLEKSASCSVRSTAPTVNAASAAAGLPTI
jgi:hypothetical protein